MNKILFFILGVFFTVNSIAQKVSNTLISKFPQTLVINIYNDVLSKMELPENLQIKLALLYAKRDSLILKELSNPSENISYNRFADSLLYAIEIKFKKLLDSAKKREYFVKVERARAVNYPIIQDTIYMDIQMDSQFGLALALYEKFRLKPFQKDSLIYYATLLKQKEMYFKQNLDSGYFDKAAFESLYMPKCLTELEYNGLLSIKNKVVAETNSRNTWYDLAKQKLVTQVGRNDSIFQLKMYYILRATVWDKFAHLPQLRNSMIQSIKPPYLLQKAWATKNELDYQEKKYSW
ncbi:MAG: hypothetical protein ABL929_11055 [Ferruginibacter sp.]|nr:hypothetical protein [Ferruginibacter sp.]